MAVSFGGFLVGLAMLLAWSAVSTVAMADEPPVAVESMEDALLDDVVVSASRSPESGFDTSRSVSVVGEDQITEGRPRSVPEALWESTGVFVQATNFGGGSPIVRGMMGPQVLVVVDGIRLNNSTWRTGPVQYLNLIDPYMVQRVEVLRGPGSVLYGSDAMGGVLSVTLLQPVVAKDGYDMGGRVAGRYSSADRGGQVHAGIDGSIPWAGALAAGTWGSSSDLVGGRGVGTQAYSGYDRAALRGGLVVPVDLRGLGSGYAKAGYFGARLDDVGRTDRLEANRNLQLYDNEDHLTYLRLGWTSPLKQSTLSLTASLQSFFERKSDFTMSESLLDREKGSRDEVSVDTMGLDLDGETAFLHKRLILHYGGMWYRDWVSATRFGWTPGTPWVEGGLTAYPDGSSYDSSGGYVLLSGVPVSAGEHSLHLSAGYRLHAMAATAPGREGVLDGTAVEFSHLGHVAQGSVQYRLQNRLNVAVSFTQGFRSPNLQEAAMLGDTGKFYHVPNPDLDPESVDSLELTVRGRMDWLGWSVAGYHSWLKDLIKREDAVWEGQTEVNGKPVAMNVNGRKGRLLGAEGEVFVHPLTGMRVGANLSYTHGVEELEDGGTQPLTRIPPLFGTVYVRQGGTLLGPWRWFAETSLRFALEQDRLSPEDEKDARIPEGGTPEFACWSLRLGARRGETLSTVLVVDNLTNQKYKYHGSGVYSPGTNAVLSVDLKF
jgi:outer membrane receptor protein involved in Fe transport